MKKVFYLLFYIFLFILIGIEESFGNTYSFRTNDNRTFCETDRLDGSFVLCSKEQISGTGLTIAAVYGPQLLETTNERICVEKGKEVEASLCSEQAAALEISTIGVATGSSQSTDSVTNSGIMEDSGSSQSTDIVTNSGIMEDSGSSQSTDIVTNSGIMEDSGSSQPTPLVLNNTDKGFSSSGFIEDTMSKIQGMSQSQIIFLAGIAFAIASLFIGIYYFAKRGKKQNINLSPSINHTASSSQGNNQTSSSQFGEALPHRVVNRWVPNPPPPPQAPLPSSPSLFTPSPNPPQPSPSQSTSKSPQAPAQPVNLQSPQAPAQPAPPQSSFLANHLGEI